MSHFPGLGLSLSAKPGKWSAEQPANNHFPGFERDAPPKPPKWSPTSQSRRLPAFQSRCPWHSRCSKGSLPPRRLSSTLPRSLGRPSVPLTRFSNSLPGDPLGLRALLGTLLRLRVAAGQRPVRAGMGRVSNRLLSPVTAGDRRTAPMLSSKSPSHNRTDPMTPASFVAPLSASQLRVPSKSWPFLPLTPALPPW
jgi:hypothetical protein